MEAVPVGSFSRFEQLRYARDVIRLEGQTLLALADRLGEAFCDAAELLYACRGNVIVTGMGKAGLVGQKIAATMASTGTQAHFLHPADARHGDLGRIGAQDAILILSYSGETEEILRLLPSVKSLFAPVVAVTGRPQSSLGKDASVVIDLGPLREACALGLAPSTSTTAMLAVGDALALVLSQMRGFGREDFAKNHPAGTLGRKLSKVDEVMRPIAECRMASDSESVRSVFVSCSRPGRRSGAIMLVNAAGVLTGIFTDSDLAKLLERKLDASIDRPISEVMTRAPKTVRLGTVISDAVSILAMRRISELPVIDEKGSPVGLLDITDIIGVLPAEGAPESSSNSTQLDDSRFEDLPSTVPFSNQNANKRRT